MKITIMKTALLLICFSLPVLLFAQDYNKDHHHYRENNKRHFTPSLSVGAQAAFPREEFAEVFNGTPIGINAALTLPIIKNLPLEVGFSFAWNSMASDEEDVFFQDTEGIFSEGTLNLNSNAYTYHFLGRFRPLNGKIRPYVDILGGFRTYSAKTRMQINDDYGGNYEAQKEVLNRDFVLSAGWAAGIQVEVARGIFIEGRFENIKGGSVSYINPETMQILENGNINYELTESKSNQMTGSLGILFNF